MNKFNGEKSESTILQGCFNLNRLLFLCTENAEKIFIFIPKLNWKKQISGEQQNLKRKTEKNCREENPDYLLREKENRFPYKIKMWAHVYSKALKYTDKHLYKPLTNVSHSISIEMKIPPKILWNVSIETILIIIAATATTLTKQKNKNIYPIGITRMSNMQIVWRELDKLGQA